MHDLFDRVIRDASAQNGSDIHIKPQENLSEKYYKIFIRIDGDLVFYEAISHQWGEQLVNKIKVLARLDLLEKFQAQDGVFVYPPTGDIRVSVFPVREGEHLVLRLLQKRESYTIETLGFADKISSELRKLKDHKEGLFLVTGPTGTGKTTSLYTILQSFPVRSEHIMTLEDPIEYRIDHVTQSEISPERNFDFSDAFRGLLRQDPDRIFIGEMRDEKTARAVMNSTLSGHFVLSTMHAGRALGVIQRFLQMGIEPFFIAYALTGVIAQRLVKKLCQVCFAEKDKISTCQSCCSSGYFGRVLLAEGFFCDEKVRELIASVREYSDGLERLKNYLIEQGGLFFEDEIERLKLERIISDES